MKRKKPIDFYLPHEEIASVRYRRKIYSNIISYEIGNNLTKPFSQKEETWIFCCANSICPYYEYCLCQKDNILVRSCPYSASYSILEPNKKSEWHKEYDDINEQLKVICSPLQTFSRYIIDNKNQKVDLELFRKLQNLSIFRVSSFSHYESLEEMHEEMLRTRRLIQIESDFNYPILKSIINEYNKSLRNFYNRNIVYLNENDSLYLDLRNMYYGKRILLPIDKYIMICLPYEKLKINFVMLTELANFKVYLKDTYDNRFYYIERKDLQSLYKLFIKVVKVHLADNESILYMKLFIERYEREEYKYTL